MTKSRLFLLFIGSFLYGNLLSAYFWVFGICLLVGLIVFRRWGRGGVVLVAFLGVLAGVLYWTFVGFGEVSYDDGPVSFEGCVSGEVDVRGDEVKYVFGKILVNGSRYPVYKYGDCFRVEGKLFATDLEESYGRYLARYNIYAVVYNAKFELLDYREEKLFMKYIYYSKGVFEGRMREMFSEPFAGFLGGLLLGSRGGISGELLDKFSDVGLTHIIAISGYNITIIINLLSRVFGFLSRRWRVVISTFCIFVFVILVGASASVMRAALMGTISLMALVFEREYYCFLALVVSAFLMTLLNPKILVYDVGFQLSFLATAGMIIFVPRLKKYFMWVPEAFFLRENLLVTLSAQIFTVPLILLYFKRFSPIAILANLFVLPFIPWAMLFGFTSVVLSFVWYGGGIFVGAAAYLCLKVVIILVDIFAMVY